MPMMMRTARIRGPEAPAGAPCECGNNTNQLQCMPCSQAGEVITIGTRSLYPPGFPRASLKMRDAIGEFSFANGLAQLAITSVVSGRLWDGC